MSIILSDAVPPTPPRSDENLPALCGELQRRGWRARVVRSRPCGELDVRLVVGPVGQLRVELLGPFGESACGRRWQAVRALSGSRVVWCGPPRRAPAAAVIKFVEDLLGRDPAELTGRYTRLG